MSVSDAWPADPDLSNPTRPRMERPLDTIRSFEAAIDGSYNRRASFRAGGIFMPTQGKPANYNADWFFPQSRRIP